MLCALGLDLLDADKDIEHVAGEPVELGDHQYVALTDQIQQQGELCGLPRAPARLLRPDDIAACLVSSLLDVQRLIVALTRA